MRSRQATPCFGERDTSLHARMLIELLSLATKALITGLVNYVLCVSESAIYSVFSVLSVSCGLPLQHTSRVGGMAEIGRDSVLRVVNLPFHRVLFGAPDKMPGSPAVLMPI